MWYSSCARASGGEGDRTPDLVNAIHALSQLSYAPGTYPADGARREPKILPAGKSQVKKTALAKRRVFRIFQRFTSPTRGAPEAQSNEPLKTPAPPASHAEKSGEVAETKGEGGGIPSTSAAGAAGTSRPCPASSSQDQDPSNG